MSRVTDPLDDLSKEKRALGWMTPCRILLDGFWVQLGVVFFWAGVFWLVGGQVEAKDWVTVYGTWQTTEKVTTDLAANVYCHTYSYWVENVEYQDKSCGGSPFPNGNSGEDDLIIQYRQSDPTVTRIHNLSSEESMHRYDGLPWMLLGLGFLLLFYAFRYNAKDLFLLQWGELTEGKVVPSKQGALDPHTQTYELQYRVQGRSYHNTTKVPKHVQLDTTLLYHPKQPEDCVPYRQLTSHYQLDSSTLQVLHKRAVWWRLLPTLLGISLLAMPLWLFLF